MQLEMMNYIFFVLCKVSEFQPTTATVDLGIINTRKWSGRRRPGYKPKLNPLAARAEAAMKIGALSDEKVAYYRAKLEMRQVEHLQRCAEHELRMKVLSLEQQRQQLLIDRECGTFTCELMPQEE